MTVPDDIERYTALYNAQQPRVYAYAVSRAGRQLADEVVAETFLVAWRRFADIPPAPLPWLLVVARTVLLEQYRAETRRQSLVAELRTWTGEQELRTGDVADEVTERTSVLAALTHLSEDDLELVTLVSWHGLTPREVARVIGCSTATYFVRLHRARKRLEQAMAAEAPAEHRRVPRILNPTKEYIR